MSRLLMIAEKVHDRGGRYLLAVYDDAVVAVRRQIDVIPLEPISMALGAVRFFRRDAITRDLRTEIATSSHEQLRKRYRGTRVIPLQEITTVELTRGKRRSTLRFNRASGRRRRFFLTSADEVDEVATHLQRLLGSRFMDRAIFG